MATEQFTVDESIWKACAGKSVKIPSLHSRVYYFPEGHVEQSSPPIPHPHSPLPPLIHSRVISLNFFSDPLTDEVYSKILLQPITNSDSTPVPETSRRIENDQNNVISFAKILTPSDANNGGGFSVPRFCADSIFPPLDFNSDPPVQNLSITDLKGVVWEFRHIYRGTPRRHLLTTGWSKFVNFKKLIAGDSVVFMRDNESGRLFVGIRRVSRRNGRELGRWGPHAEEQEGGGMVGVAIERAKRGMAFEVVYYPRGGNGGMLGREEEFVVGAEAVEEAMSVFWTAGMRVKMPVETEDSSRITWFQGTVSSVPENGAWRGLPWRMLQVETQLN